MPITHPCWSGLSPSPAIGIGGVVYVPAFPGGDGLYALDGRTGAKKWTAANNLIPASPVIDADGTVLFTTTFGLHAIKVDSGAKDWSSFDGGYSSPAIGADGSVYFGTQAWSGRGGVIFEGGRVIAVIGNTGKKRWEFETGNHVVSSPAIGLNGTLYVGSNDWKVYALDTETGAKVWEFSTGGRVISSPLVLADGTVVVGSTDYNLYALDGNTGDKRWQFTSGSWITSSPAVGSDGIIYVGSQDHKLYAIKNTALLANSAWPMFRKNPQRPGQQHEGPKDYEIVRQFLPALSVSTDSVARKLDLSFEVPTAGGFELEVSEDLVSWLPIPESNQTAKQAGNILRWQQSVDEGTRFYRATVK